jgi:hypothetical protein
MSIVRGSALRASLAAVAALAGATVFAETIEIFPGIVFDTDIKITKAVGSPAITIAYSGARAARLEIRLNGKAVGEKKLDATKSSGETGYTLNVGDLQPGDNLVEAVLFDGNGRELGTQKTVLTVERAENLPVSIRFPKMGETVQGSVKIDVGLGIQTRNTYVSLFVNGQFIAMKNFPPYSFYWDTTKEQNGWHEVEVWSFDESQTTRKSPAVRLFVQNPGGRTERPANVAAPALADPAVSPTVGDAKGLKGVDGKATAASGDVHVVAPNVTVALSHPVVVAPVTAPSAMKGVGASHAEAHGVRTTTPNSVKRGSGARTVEAMATAPSRKYTEINFGTRVESSAPISIWFNGSPVQFDVEPRITNGIPLTPFRHLYEHAGGKVDWFQQDRVVTANGLGHDVWMKIGEINAKVDGKSVALELAPFIDRRRTIIPLSFIRECLNVEVDIDPVTGHVLITKAAEKK